MVMPYIPINKRGRLNLDAHLDTSAPDNAGELNYTLTNLCHVYLQRHGVNYKNINEVIGVLECAKLELYRMIAAPYEDKKRLANGSVSALDAINLEDVR
jgi:hypothetical protein